MGADGICSISTVSSSSVVGSIQCRSSIVNSKGCDSDAASTSSTIASIVFCLRRSGVPSKTGYLGPTVSTLNRLTRE